MRHVKAIAAKWLVLAVELAISFLSLDLLWELMLSKPPFSFGLYLFAGGLMAAGNCIFLRKRRLLWQILLFNGLLCAVWIPPLSLTLDHTVPSLLVFQIPFFLFPLLRGYHWGVTPVTIRKMRTYGGYTVGYTLFYLIVASYAPQFLSRAPMLLALLALTLLAAVVMRTSGRNTVRAGAASLRHFSAFLLPLVLAAAAAAMCALLLAFHGQLLLLLQRGWGLLVRVLQAFVDLLSYLFQPPTVSGEMDMSIEDWQEEYADMTLPEPVEIDPRLFRLVLAGIMLVLAAVLLAALVCWLWKNRNRVRAPEDDGDDAFTRSPLSRVGLLVRLRRFLRMRSFLLRCSGTPRAALLELERWGSLHRCRRRTWETPREYLERLADGPLQGLLGQEQQALYRLLEEDVDRSLYGGLPPSLPRQRVRELLTAIRHARRHPPAPASSG